MNASSSTVRNEMTKKLLDYGFSKVKATTLYNENSEITTINIDKAKNENIPLYTIDEVTEYPLIVKEDVEPLSVLELFGKYVADILF